MKKSILLFFIVTSFSGCKKDSERINSIIDSGNLTYARQELLKIEIDGSNSKLIEVLNRKIDSIYYNRAYVNFKAQQFKKSNEELNYIGVKSLLYDKKMDLIKRIDYSKDSIIFNNALNEYSQNNFKKAIDILGDINHYSSFYKKRDSLLNISINKLKIQRKSITRKELKLSRAVISSIFGTPIHKIKSKEINFAEYAVHYYKNGKKWTYKVKFEDKTIFWAGDYGWRSDKLSYSESKDYYYITEVFNDGSKRSDRFKKGSL